MISVISLLIIVAVSFVLFQKTKKKIKKMNTDTIQDVERLYKEKQKALHNYRENKLNC